jgi:hypothetical protein
MVKNKKLKLEKGDSKWLVGPFVVISIHAKGVQVIGM